MSTRLFRRLAVLVSIALVQSAVAGDWPVWRHDAQHSASSAEDLPESLRLQWTLTLPPLKPAWPDQPSMPFDAVYEPIVAGQTMFIASSRTDSVAAYDARTGEQKWRFLADGPVRFAPLWNANK